MQEEIRQAFQEVHQAWPISLAGTAIIGLVLWLMGRKMIRPAMAICGIFIGASIGFTLSHQFDASDGLLLTWTGVGAVVGMLAVWLLYRAWMAISLGLLAIVIVPATAIAFTGTPDPQSAPPPHPAAKNLADQSSQFTDANQLINAGQKDGNQDSPNEQGTDAKDSNSGNTGSTDLDGIINQFSQEQIDQGIEKGKEVINEGIEKGQEVIDGLIDAIRASFGQQSDLIESWWESMDSAQQKTMLTSMAIGLGVGLLIGFFFPNLTASIETALIGTILLFIATRGIWASYSDTEWSWVSKPQQIFITIGLITALGMVLQWTFFRKAADK